MPKLISQKNFSNQISANITTNSDLQVTLYEFPKTSFRSGKYQIQVSSGSSYQTTEFLVVHDGTTTYNTEYGTIKNNIILSSFDSDISGNNVRILITPTSSNITQFKIIGTLVEI